MNEIAEITKKYGVTGVLCAWLSITTIRVNNLESKLEDCWSDRMYEIRNQQKSENKTESPSHLFAIIPEKLTIKIKKV
jgi:hypothetical protein